MFPPPARNARLGFTASISTRPAKEPELILVEIATFSSRMCRLFSHVAGKIRHVCQRLHLRTLRLGKPSSIRHSQKAKRTIDGPAFSCLTGHAWNSNGLRPAKLLTILLSKNDVFRTSGEHDHGN
jgi:hypothetical protein